MRPNLMRKPPRALEHRIDLTTDGVCVTVEGNDLSQVQRVARRIRSVMAEQQAAERLHAQARGGEA